MNLVTNTPLYLELREKKGAILKYGFDGSYNVDGKVDCIKLSRRKRENRIR